MELDVMKQELIDYLMELIKEFKNDEKIELAKVGEAKKFELSSNDSRCDFSLDMNRKGRFESKLMLQSRYLRTNDFIVRLDINSPPHTNPDGTMTGRNHIHILKEADGKKLNYAYDVEDILHNLKGKVDNVNDVFQEFCTFNNIILDDYQLTI